jgi:hypothetical protein
MKNGRLPNAYRLPVSLLPAGAMCGAVSIPLWSWSVEVNALGRLGDSLAKGDEVVVGVGHLELAGAAPLISHRHFPVPTCKTG